MITIPLPNVGCPVPFPIITLGGIGLLHALTPEKTQIPESKVIAPELLNEAFSVQVKEGIV